MIDLDINCSGCDVELTIDNAGGYRCYCEKCVSAIGPIPNDNLEKRSLGWRVEGKYPNFKWVEGE